MLKLRRKNYATHSPSQAAAYKAELVNINGPVRTALEWAGLEQKFSQQARSLVLHNRAYGVAGFLSLCAFVSCLVLMPSAPQAFGAGLLLSVLLIVEFLYVTPYYQPFTHSLGAFSAADFSTITPGDYVEVQYLVASDVVAQRYTQTALADRKDLVYAELSALRTRQAENEVLRKKAIGEQIREDLAAAHATAPQAGA